MPRLGTSSRTERLLTGSWRPSRRRWSGSAVGRTPVVVDDDGAVANRKTPVGGFPWAVGHEVAGDIVIVLAVFHQHRRPDYWTTRQH